MDELKTFVYTHGAYWGVALAAVVVSKLYTEGEEQTTRSVLRSFVAASLFTYLALDYGQANNIDTPTLSITIFAGSFLIDVIVELLIHFKKKVLADPDGILQLIKSLWSNRK